MYVHLLEPNIGTTYNQITWQKSSDNSDIDQQVVNICRTKILKIYKTKLSYNNIIKSDSDFKKLF